MDTSFSILFDMYIEYFGTDNIYLSFYLLNLIFGAIAFKLGFARKLPLVKTIFVYIMLAVGVYILTIFSILKLPITESLIVVSLVLGIYRFRLHRERN
ncbi:YlaH-like family protein [Oceanobacillus manasiensis]|uniref:YlaH-like family protein n=1 Tax=Oceanobacillus manasiensis TaxID=586413 RepID=UPI0005A9EB8A|nr:YlaH-like family protein [Oceanobacillus manasiensis]